MANSWGGSVPSGTAFPVTPATGDVYFRTDRGISYYWNGTNWLSVDTLTLDASGGSHGATVAAAVDIYLPLDTTYDLYIDRCVVSFFSSSITASAYWIYTLNKTTAPIVDTQLGSAVNIQSGANSTWLLRTITVGAVIVRGTWPMLHGILTKASTPGPTYSIATIYARMVG